jgi:hypothetical protein
MGRVGSSCQAWFRLMAEFDPLPPVGAGRVNGRCRDLTRHSGVPASEARHDVANRLVDMTTVLDGLSKVSRNCPLLGRHRAATRLRAWWCCRQVVRPGRALIITKAEIFAVKEGKEFLCALMQQTIIVMHDKEKSSRPRCVAHAPFAAEPVADQGWFQIARQASGENSRSCSALMRWPAPRP